MYFYTVDLALQKSYFNSRFKNNEGMTFDEVAGEPDQSFDLIVDQNGVHEYPVKYV